MSGTQVSSFAPANILFDAASGATTASVQNQLLRNDLLAKLAPYQVQQAQQQTGEAETEMLARAASGLLSMPDEASRAAAYPSAVSDLQKLGFAKNAPSIYPGEAALRRVQQMGLSLKDQYSLGLVSNPAITDALKNVYGSNAPAAPGTATASGPDPVAGMPREQALDAIAARESGNKNVPNAEGASTASGYWQMLDSTWKDAAKLAGIDVSKYPRAMDAPWMAQRAAAGALFDKYGATPWAASAPKGGAAIAAAAPPGAPPQATPQAAPGAAAPLAPVQVAGPGAPTPSTAATAPSADLVGPRPLPTIGPNSPVVTPQSLANTPAPVVAQNALLPPPPSAAPGMPAPQPIPMAPGSAAPAPAQPAAAPPQTGTQSAQFQAAQGFLRQAAQLESLPGAASNPQVKAAVEYLKSKAAAYMQADSVVKLPDGTQLHVLTGKTDNAAEAAKNYQETAPGVFTSPGQAPMFAPTGRPVEGVGPDPNDPSKQVPGHWISQSGTRTFFPAATESPQAGYTVRQEAYKRDSAKVDDYAKVGQQAQSDQVRIQEMQDQLDRIYTGPGSGTKVAMQAWAERWLPASISSQFSQQVDGMSDAAASQVFNKLAFRNATTQERGVLGARGGALATKMFVQSNPGMELLTDSNKRMLKVMQVANQADIDYTQGALAHFGDNEKRFADSGGKQYDSLTTYERQWQAQRNPQVYAAAAGALAGLPPKDGEINGVKVHGWATGLSDTEYERALNIVSRADPRAVVQGKTGRLSMQPANTQTATPPTVTGADAAHPPLPPGFTVVQ